MNTCVDLTKSSSNQQRKMKEKLQTDSVDKNVDNFNSFGALKKKTSAPTPTSFSLSRTTPDAVLRRSYQDWGIYQARFSR